MLGSLPLFDAKNSDRLLTIAATQAQLGRAEQAIDDQDILVNARIDDLRLAIGPDNEDWRHLALDDAAREDDIDPAAVVEDGYRPPRWAVTGKPVAVVARGLGRNDRRRWNGLPLAGGLSRIGPGNGRHIERFAGAQFDHVGTPVGGDDEIGRDVWARWFDEDVDAAACTDPLGVPDNPAGGVTRRDRPGTGQALARFQRNIGDLPRRSIDLIECTFRPGVDLNGVIVAFAAGFDAGGGIGVLHLACRCSCCGPAARDCPCRRRVKWSGPIIRNGGLHGRQSRNVGIVAELRRPIRGAACQHGGREQQSAKAGLRKAGMPELRGNVRVIGSSPATMRLH